MKTNTIIAMLNVINERIGNACSAIVNDFPNRETSKEAVLNDLDTVMDIIAKVNEEMECRQLKEDYEAVGGNYSSFADFCADYLKKAF